MQLKHRALAKRTRMDRPLSQAIAPGTEIQDREAFRATKETIIPKLSEAVILERILQIHSDLCCAIGADDCDFHANEALQKVNRLVRDMRKDADNG